MAVIKWKYLCKDYLYLQQNLRVEITNRWILAVAEGKIQNAVSMFIDKRVHTFQQDFPA